MCAYQCIFVVVHIYLMHVIVGNKLSGTVPTEFAQLGGLGDLNLGKLQQSITHIDAI